LTLHYNGSAFNGWQRQPNDPSVQETLEIALATILNHAVELVGCGRTDAGVHARNYVAHFDTPNPLPENLLLRINKMLPKSISINTIRRVVETAHARFDAESRTYKYFIHFKKDPFLFDRSFWIHSHDFNLGKMNSAAKRLLHYCDFKTFEKKGSDNKTSLCTIQSAKWEILNAEEWCFTITANRFLRNMVRRITGTLLMIGIQRLSIEEMEAALNKRDVLEVNIAPPAHGLFLWQITYPSNIYLD
jgi:tRNA pseudouridine38-40 synthase